MLEQLMKNYHLQEGFTLEKFMGNCSLWVGPHAEAGEESEEEGAAETASDELTITPIPCPHVLLRESR